MHGLPADGPGSAITFFPMPSPTSPGFCVSCPESGATVMHDMQEIGPTYFFSPAKNIREYSDHCAG